MLDPDNEKLLKDHDELLALKLFRVDPVVGPKYRFLA